jgi:hypothetical protein
MFNRRKFRVISGEAIQNPLQLLCELLEIQRNKLTTAQRHPRVYMTTAKRIHSKSRAGTSGGFIKRSPVSCPQQTDNNFQDSYSLSA